MPRPPVKRSKLNQSNQATKRVPKTPSGGSSPAARRRQLQEQLGDKKVGRVPNDSDDSDRLVTKAPGLLSRRRVPRQEIYASGGVGDGDKVAAHQSARRKKKRVFPAHQYDASPRASSATVATGQPRQSIKAVDCLSTSNPSTESESTVEAKTKNFASAPMSANQSRVRTQASPTAETSVLGTIKMRKRQASILQLIDGQDSSILDEDMDEFLPLHQSTPLHGSRKRKLSPQQAPSTPAPSAHLNEPLDTTGQLMEKGEPQLPEVSSRSTIPGQRSPQGADSDTMAPPVSSSTNPSPVKKQPPGSLKHRSKRQNPTEAKALSTSALQAFMPNRRPARPRRERAAKAAGVFDIPEDSNDDQDELSSDREANESDLEASPSFVASPRPKQRKIQNKQAPTKYQKYKKPLSVGSEATAAGGSVGRRGANDPRAMSSSAKPTTEKGTKHRCKTGELSTLSPSKSAPRNTACHDSAPDSPSPPTSSFSTPAKTSQQHQKSASTATNSAAAAGPAIPPRKHHISQYRILKQQHASDDKENRPCDSSADYSDGDHDRNLPTSTTTPSRNRKREKDISPRPDHDNDDDGDASGAGRAMTTENARLARKFEDVDKWQMEFEDVSSLSS